MRINPNLALLSIVFLFIIGCLCYNGFSAEEVHFDGEVIDKHYTPETGGSGSGVSSNGGVVFVDTSDPEAFSMIVRKSDKIVFSIKTEPSVYYNVQVGDKVECVELIGSLTGKSIYVKCRTKKD